MKKRQEKLVGPVVSLPTFVDDNHNLLLDRQEKHIRWLMDHGIGVNGNGVLLAAGGYGEGYFLDDGELFALIDMLVDTAAGRAPTMVGVFDLNARMAARRSRYAGDAGIDFIELGLPHYSCPVGRGRVPLHEVRQRQRRRWTHELQQLLGDACPGLRNHTVADGAVHRP